jgi:hypothetical protein
MHARTTTGSGGGEPAVLEDPSGRRARWMRRAGRVVFAVFLAWLVAILLGGLGLAPVPGIPLTHALRPSAGPPPLARLPAPRQPSPADLLPALPDTALPAQVSPAALPKRGRSAHAPGRTRTTVAGAVRGHSATAPGQTRTTRSRPPRPVPPGHLRTTTSP